MQYRRNLLYHPIRQEAIAQISPTLLSKWSLSDRPTMLAQLEIPSSQHKHWDRIPPAVLLPDLERIAIVEEEHPRNYLKIYRWDDLSLIESIEIPGNHSGEPAELTCVNLTACRDYLYIMDVHGEIALLCLTQNTWIGLTLSTALYPTKAIFDRNLSLIVVEQIDMDADYQVYRIDDLQNNRLTLIGHFSEVIASHQGELRLNPFADAIVWTGYHCRVKYHTFQRDQLASAPEVSDGGSSNDPVFTQQWGIDFPYIQHPQSSHFLWCSCLAFQTSEIMLFGAGLAIAQINMADGRVLAEYQTQSFIYAIEYDPTHLRVIAITSDGFVVVPISDFDTTTPYLNALTLPPEAQIYLANPLPAIAQSPADTDTHQHPQNYPRQDTQRWSSTHVFIVTIGGIVAIACFWMAIKSFLPVLSSNPSSPTPTQSIHCPCSSIVPNFCKLLQVAGGFDRKK